ncbi:MAG: tetratricopeptide repeat-containing sensor histidine kinase [Saprospiraceae bacterium]|nr:tetratricopeptide repeat-containing sensor histidine kinase [Saprospiraceae bacterium]
MRYPLTLLCFLGYITLFAQSQDSLILAKLDTASSIKSKIIIHEELIQYYLKTRDTRVIQYAKEGLVLTKEGKDSLHMIVFCNHLVRGYYRKSEYDSCLTYGHRARELIEQFSKSSIKRKAKIYNNLGSIYIQVGQHKKAIEWLLKALEIREEINDPLVATTYTNLGLEYLTLSQYDKALKYTRKAIEIKKEQKKWASLFSNYNNMGLIYKETYQLDSALIYFDKLKRLAQEHNMMDRYESHRGNVAQVYRTQRKNKAALKEAKIAYNSLSNSLDKGNVKTLYAIARPAIILRYLEEADWALNQIKQIGIDTSIGHFTTYYLLKRDYFIAAEEYDSVAYYQKVYSARLKKNKAAEYEKNVRELEEKYKAKQKQKEIDFLKQQDKLTQLELSSVSTQRTFAFIVIGLMLLILILLYLQYRYRVRTAKQLEQLILARDKLYSVIGHDLKNPLIGFKSVTGSLSNNFNHLDQEEIKFFINKLDKSANALYLLIQNLTQWAGTHSNQLTYTPHRLMIDRVVIEVFKLFRLNAERANISLISEVPLESPVYADLNIVQTILRNLVDNAIKFSNSEDEISISLQETPENTAILVKDTGVGMSKEELAKVFEDAGSIRNSSNKGTGLGLALCKELAIKQGGDLTVESQEGKGTTFSLIIKKKIND